MPRAPISKEEGSGLNKAKFPELKPELLPPTKIILPGVPLWKFTVWVAETDETSLGNAVFVAVRNKPKEPPLVETKFPYPTYTKITSLFTSAGPVAANTPFTEPVSPKMALPN
jgi:hypothetical protein